MKVIGSACYRSIDAKHIHACMYMYTCITTQLHDYRMKSTVYIHLLEVTKQQRCMSVISKLVT